MPSFPLEPISSFADGSHACDHAETDKEGPHIPTNGGWGSPLTIQVCVYPWHVPSLHHPPFLCGQDRVEKKTTSPVALSFCDY